MRGGNQINTDVKNLRTDGISVGDSIKMKDELGWKFGDRWT